jgi:ElaB/YqjD/DUF883 family membrane-anchored ribosome-binding protein
MMQSTPTSARARVSHALGEAVEASMHALDSGSQLAAGKIGDMAGDLRESAADLARTGAKSVGDATVAAQRQLGQVARATRRYVGKQPWRSVVIAAVLAAAATALAVAVFRNPRDGQ